jgi:hypothetical protein
LFTIQRKIKKVPENAFLKGVESTALAFFIEVAISQIFSSLNILDCKCIKAKLILKIFCFTIWLIGIMNLLVKSVIRK